MNRKSLILLLICVSIIVLISCLGYYVYSNLGYKEYRNAMKSINNLQEGKSEAREMFFEAPKENQYGGILGYVNKRNKTILLWTEKGPKIFKFDDKTLLYVYYICTEENLARYNSSLGFGLHRTMELPDAWYKIARKGTYGGVILDKKGNVTEAHLSDIWSFLPIDLNVSCKGK